MGQETKVDSEIRTVLHGLRNAVNLMVTCARCLHGEEDPGSERAAFAASLEQGADEARALLARLQALTDERCC